MFLLNTVPLSMDKFFDKYDIKLHKPKIMQS